MPRELKNANITHVSYVDKAANQTQFFLTKAANALQPTFTKEVKLLTKADDAQQLVYGVVYAPDAEDAHGDFMTAAEIEKAAHAFMKDYRNIDKQHDFEAGVGEVVESYVAPADMEIGGETITKGTWVLVTKASDDIWAQIQKGEITGYSMAGTAEVVQKSDSLAKQILDGLQKMLGIKTDVEKGAVKDKYNKNAKSRGFWAAQDALIAVLQNWDDWDWTTSWEEDPEKIKEALQDFSDIVTQLLTQDAADIVKAIGAPPVSITKAGAKISADRMKRLQEAYDTLGSVIKEVEGEEKQEEMDGEEVVKAEDIQKAVTDAVSAVVTPINDRLAALEKGANEDPPANPTEPDVATVVQDAVTKAMAPVLTRVENLEKARGISNQLPADTTTVTKTEGPAYMRHLR